MITEDARQAAEILREASVEQRDLFREMCSAVAEFDQAAREYPELHKLMKR